VDDTADDVNSSSNTVESELLVGSKKRNNNNQLKIACQTDILCKCTEMANFLLYLAIIFTKTKLLKTRKENMH
jgi:hypothetical protein